MLERILEIAKKYQEGNVSEISFKIIELLGECKTKEEMENTKQEMMKELKINSQQFAYLLMIGIA